MARKGQTKGVNRATSTHGAVLTAMLPVAALRPAGAMAIFAQSLSPKKQ